MNIKTGCLAIVIKSDAGNTGKIVTVGKYLGMVFGFVGNNRWVVNVPMNGTCGSTVYHLNEDQMQRIDGEKKNEKKEQFIER